MSANNVFIYKEIDGKFFGWDVMAEASTSDNPTRKLHLVRAKSADSKHELYEKLMEGEYLGPEYGMVNADDGLPKDGTPIEVVI